MFKLVKFLIALVILAALVYFAAFVKLGEKTLWEHLVGISQTDEAEELKSELGEKAKEIQDDVSSKVPAIGKDEDETKAGKGEEETEKKDSSPLSDLSDEDRQALIELLKKKNK